MIGADILDKTGQNAFSFGRLREEPTWWQLDTNQRIHFDEVRCQQTFAICQQTFTIFEEIGPSSCLKHGHNRSFLQKV